MAEDITGSVKLKKEITISGVGTLKEGTYTLAEVGGEAAARHLVSTGYATWAGKGSQAANEAASDAQASGG